jgi:hypothetical protein
MPSHRRPRIEVAGYVNLFPDWRPPPPPISDAALGRLNFRQMLRWCAGPDGRLQRDRLKRVAKLKGYDIGWVKHLAGRHWERAWNDVQRWRERQLAEDE